MTVSVRSATPADADRIADWQVQMARETEDRALDRERVGRGVARCLADPIKGRYLVAELDGEPVGSLLLTTEWSDWRDGWFWWIQSVFLAPAARGHGVYKAMQAKVVADAQADPDVRGVRLYVEEENAHARRVYAALGFENTSYRLYEIDFDAT
ncbi:MAG: GNAT family N-acetyltransferase [Planctomycetota bacterium]